MEYKHKVAAALVLGTAIGGAGSYAATNYFQTQPVEHELRLTQDQLFEIQSNLKKFDFNKEFAGKIDGGINPETGKPRICNRLGCREVEPSEVKIDFK